MLYQMIGSYYGNKLDGAASGAITKGVGNRDVHAEVALVYIQHLDKNELTTQIHYAQFGITQVEYANGIVENIYPPEPTIYREGVKSVTFSVRVYQCYAIARWMIHVWG